MMVKILLYGYATGIFSSRRIASALQRDLAFRLLAAGSLPRHRTICEFRKRHLEDFKDLFVQVVAIAREMGLTRLGTLAVDASKVRASASRRKALWALEQEQKLLFIQRTLQLLLNRMMRIKAVAQCVQYHFQQIRAFASVDAVTLGPNCDRISKRFTPTHR